jgi:hypothetical protein
VLPDEIPLLLPLYPRQMNRTFPFDKPNPLRPCIVGWDGDHPGHSIGPQVPFFHPALLLLRPLAEHLAYVPPQFPLPLSSPDLGDEHHRVFALPLAVA